MPARRNEGIDDRRAGPAGPGAPHDEELAAVVGLGPGRGGPGGRRRRRRRAVVVAAVALVALSSCSAPGSPDRGGEGRRSDPYLPPRPAVLQVVMRDYAFDHPTTLPPGRFVVRLGNVGTVPHDVTLLELPEDLPPIGEVLRGAAARPVLPVAQLLAHDPGTTGTFTVELGPGRYGLVCGVRDADGVSHAVKGMSSEIRVAAPRRR